MLSIFFLGIVLIRLHPREVDVESPTESWVDFVVTCIYPFASLMGYRTLNSSRAVHSRRVSSLGGYGEDCVYSRPYFRLLIILIIGCVAGIAFGGIHCLGWNFFQGHTEQILWRAASLAIISAPVLILPFWGYVIKTGNFEPRPADVVPIVSIVIYSIARVILIVLIFMSFRSLPPGTYDTVTWTDPIPHF
jgi:hypothetical protein